MRQRRKGSLVRDQTGATAVEYGLIIAAMGGAILFALYFFGNMINVARDQVGGSTINVSNTDGGAGATDGRFIHTR